MQGLAQNKMKEYKTYVVLILIIYIIIYHTYKYNIAY